MTSISQSFRTDVSTVGPLATDNNGKGDVFIIASVISGKTFLHPVLNYVSNIGTGYMAACEFGFDTYLSGGKTPDSSGSYNGYYYKYKKAVTPKNSSVIGGTDMDITIEAFSDINCKNSVGFLESVKLESSEDYELCIVSTPKIITFNTNDPHSFPGMPNLLCGCNYFTAENSSLEIIPASTTTSDGIPTGIGNKTGSKTSDYLFMPIYWFESSDCSTKLSTTDVNNIMYHQCGRSSAFSGEDKKGYYTTYCGTSLKKGITSSTLCNNCRGNLFYYATNDTKCGESWPDDVSYMGLDKKTVKATTVYGYADDGICSYEDVSKEFKSESIQSYVTSILDDGIATVQNPKQNIPIWVWILVSIMAIIIVICLVVLLLKTINSSKKKDKSKGDKKSDK